MIIVCKNADFSKCGLGKITFTVSNEVNTLLDSLYDDLDYKYKLVFQQFIDEIGGLNGEIFNSLYRLVIPAFANSSKECFTDVVTKSVFRSGGGDYNKYAANITLNRGVGAQFDQVNGINILNFNSIHDFEGSLIKGIVFDTELTNVPLISSEGIPMYSQAWQLLKAGNSDWYNISVGAIARKVAILNVLEDNIYSFYDNTEYTKVPSNIDISYWKTKGTTAYSLYNRSFNKVTTAMYFLGKGLTLANGRILNKAVWNFYTNLKDLQ